MTHHNPRTPRATAQAAARADTSAARRGFAALVTLTVLLMLALLARPVHATEIQRVVSPGGIEAWLVEDHTIPLISVDFAFEGGATQDPNGKEGLTNLMSTLLDEGAGDLDSQAYQTRLEDLSVEIGFNAGRDSFSGSMKTLTANRDAAFDMLSLAITDPHFDKDAIERMRTRLIAGIRNDSRDPDSVASERWFAAAFPGHPYGRRTEGTEKTLAAITRDDLVTLHKHLMARGNLKIAVVGAIDAKTLGPLLDKTFGKLPAKAELVKVPDATPKTGVTENVNMDVPQAVIRLGLPGLKRADPDFIPAYVMNHILGGGSFSSRLYEEVREKRGLAYSVWSYLAPYDHAGILMAGTGTRSDSAGETLKIMEEQIARMAKDGPTADELKKAKSYLTGSYALRFDTSGKIANQLVGIQMENLGIDYINKRNDLIEAVTLDDVKRVAKELLGGKTPTIVTVGRAAS
ncbi:zinc protease [Breoghania corrubedonensis]|uniref:Zinc protease n=1 Tax=Breoghania corrubedonensis TaxID=665038 RepID=A0A2T5VEX3_9HYPH|nr:pitrilysin family protein [Breoghania corrubedonensis]PTW62305.1 zinc protease [Breoghania corrubedonensis]